MAALPLHPRLAGQDLRGHDFRGQDLSRVDLTGADLTGADLTGACLFQACLEGAEFALANLTNADLREAHGAGVGFAGANLTEADLTACALPHASFTRANLHQAAIIGADLSGARFSHATLTGVDLSSTALKDAHIQHSDVTHARFRDAPMRGVRLSHLQGYTTADWVGADLREADTCGAYDLRRFAHDQNYLAEFYARSPRHRLVYFLWWATSDCGRSLSRWSGWTAVIAVAFAGLYSGLPIAYGDHATWLSPLYFSVVTLTTLGFGDALPTNVVGQAAVMVEVLCGYFMLGGLLAILTNKMARRAD